MVAQRSTEFIKKYGLRGTLPRFAVELRSIIDFYFPRTVWGERVDLRPVTKKLTTKEVEQVYRWSNDVEVLQLSGAEPTEMTFNDFMEQLARKHGRSQKNERVFYIVTQEGNLIGRIGLFTIDWPRREGEVGIVIGKEYWGKRYGSDAMMLLLCYVFSDLPLDRVYAGTYSDNIRAQRLFTGIGFRIIGPARRYVASSDSYVEDGVGMEITRKEFICNTSWEYRNSE
jgi:RimJ/RimL family protein N-acetyltransferase